MATPAMIPNSVSATVTPGSAGNMRVNTFAADGSALDVSTGYVIGFMNAVPASDSNPLAAPVDLSAEVTPAFDATGVTLAFTAAEATAIAVALSTVRSSIGFGLSNDAGTTETLAGIIALTVRPEAQFKA